MKKILIAALVLLISLQLGAQTRPPQGQGRPQGQPQGQAQPSGPSKAVTAAIAAVEKAKKDTDNVKKAATPAPWIKLATSYTDLYEAPVNTLRPEMQSADLRIFLANERVLSSEVKTIQGENMTIDTYADKKLYINEDGVVVAWQITSDKIPANTLDNAISALNKAIETDTKNQKTKDISAQLDRIKVLYTNDGLFANTLGDYAAASKNFEAAFDLSNHKALNATDTVLAYYAGLTASFVEDYDRTIKFIGTALDLGYDSDGDAYSFIADAYKSKADIEKAKDILNVGFQKYPTNQNILISLINAYIESNDDTEKILELLRVAQRNEPNNPSLYYAEGEVWKKLDNMDEALKCYEKSTQIDPNYAFGYFATGAAYYDRAIEIQKLASDEPDDTKYEAMIKEMETYLESALSPLEKGYEISKAQDIKDVLVEYLKNIYYRFREKSPEHMAAYEKYNALFLEGR